MGSEIDIELELEDDEIPEYAVERRNVVSDSSDRTVEVLHNKKTRGLLSVQPSFQRSFVWDVKKASRLVESVLLGIPLPTIYLSEESDGKEYVIDGQQRLTSLFCFIAERMPDQRDFRLTGLQVLAELSGLTFTELTEELQQRVLDYPLRTVLFRKGSDPDLKFEIFERLNTGSVPLNDQELRNCIYRGPYNDLAHELAMDPDFRFLMGTKEADRRRKDVELVLRFLAFQNATYLRYKPPMKNFLNRDCERFRTPQQAELKALEQKFKNAVQLTRTVFGANAFKRFRIGHSSSPAGAWEKKKFNASLYDVVMYMFAEADKSKVLQRADAVREALIELMSRDEDFIRSIELSTSAVQAVQKRFDLWRGAFNQIITPGEKERRLFTLAEKRKLFDADPTCSICKNQIHDLDDSAVDHIQQFSQGGPTTLDNGRLTHRYCNWSRSRTE